MTILFSNVASQTIDHAYQIINQSVMFPEAQIALLKYDSAYRDKGVTTYPNIDQSKEWVDILSKEEGIAAKNLKEADKKVFMWQTANCISLFLATGGVVLSMIFLPPVSFLIATSGIALTAFAISYKFSKCQDATGIAYFVHSRISDFQTIFVNEKFKEWMKERKISSLGSLRELFAWMTAFKKLKYNALEQEIKRKEEEKEKLDKELEKYKNENIVAPDEIVKQWTACQDFLEESRASEFDFSMDNVEAQEPKDSLKTYFDENIANIKSAIARSSLQRRHHAIIQIIVGIATSILMAGIIYVTWPVLVLPAITTASQLATSIGVAVSVIAYSITNIRFSSKTLKFWDVIKRSRKILRSFELKQKICESKGFQKWAEQHNISAIEQAPHEYVNAFLLKPWS